MKKYLIRKVTDYFEEIKPERMGKIVYIVNEPVINKPALLFYDTQDGDVPHLLHLGFRTSNVRDVHYMRTITTGELEMVIETENSIYHLLELEDEESEQKSD